MLKEQIAADLELAFSQYGFAEPSVAQLKTACHVSLRTLYKHYPSKEKMIIAALEYRHQRYLDFLLEEAPTPGKEALLHIFSKLEQWMKEYAPHGCMSVNAIAAFPKNQQLSLAVTKHKHQLRELLGEQSQKPELASALFVLHEGVSSSWPVRGNEAVETAKQMLAMLYSIN